jgi:D-sedoheptulose 7-phosphate isomerase
VTLATNNVSLNFRVAQFGAVLERCEISGKNGTAFELELGMIAAKVMLAQLRERNGSVYVIGNGGSAGVASHAITDLVNVAKIRAFTLHDPSLLTCMTNDYGYELAFTQILLRIAKPQDLLIAISSSGNSKNIRNAAVQATKSGMLVITLSGFSRDNPLRGLGDINIWLDSSDYGVVEIGHQFLLHNLSDRFGVDDSEIPIL